LAQHRASLHRVPLHSGLGKKDGAALTGI
jgi:hypothetical protein